MGLAYNNIGNDLLIVVVLTSCCVHDASFVHHMPTSSMQNSGEVDSGPLAPKVRRCGGSGLKSLYTGRS